MKTKRNEVNIQLPRGGTDLLNAHCSVLKLALSAQLVNSTFITAHASASYPIPMLTPKQKYIPLELVRELCSCS
jgi:hypothetical protein